MSNMYLGDNLINVDIATISDLKNSSAFVRELVIVHYPVLRKI